MWPVHQLTAAMANPGLSQGIEVTGLGIGDVAIGLGWGLIGWPLKARNVPANIPGFYVYFSKKYRRHAKGMSPDFLRNAGEPRFPGPLLRWGYDPHAPRFAFAHVKKERKKTAFG